MKQLFLLNLKLKTIFDLFPVEVYLMIFLKFVIFFFFNHLPLMSQHRKISVDPFHLGLNVKRVCSCVRCCNLHLQLSLCMQYLIFPGMCYFSLYWYSHVRTITHTRTHAQHSTVGPVRWGNRWSFPSLVICNGDGLPARFSTYPLLDRFALRMLCLFIPVVKPSWVL